MIFDRNCRRGRSRFNRGREGRWSKDLGAGAVALGGERRDCRARQVV